MTNDAYRPKPGHRVRDLKTDEDFKVYATGIKFASVTSYDGYIFHIDNEDLEYIPRHRASAGDLADFYTDPDSPMFDDYFEEYQPRHRA